MLKFKNDLIKPAFSLAEMLFTMLIVAIVAVALVPMIGPNKTKSPRQKMVHGHYACYWEKQNDGTLVLKENVDGKIRNSANPNYCEYLPPKANFYSVTVIAASGDGYGYNASNIPDVYYEQNAAQYGVVQSGTIALNNFASGYASSPELVQKLIDKIVQDEGPLAAGVDLYSSSGGKGDPCGGMQTWNKQGSNLPYVVVGDPSYPSSEYGGADGGKRNHLRVFFWVDKNTQVSFSDASSYTDDVSLTVDNSTFTLTAAGQGGSAYSVYSNQCSSSINPSELGIHRSGPYMLTGTVNPSVDRTYNPNETTSVRYYYDSNDSTKYTTLNVKYKDLPHSPYNFSSLPYPASGLSDGADSQFSYTGSASSYSGSGNPSCSGSCEPQYTLESNYGNSNERADGIAIAMNNFAWNYNDNGVKLRATVSGESGQSYVKLFSRIDNKLRMTPAKTNMSGGSLTTSKLELVKPKAGGGVDLLKVFEVNSGKNADSTNAYVEFPAANGRINFNEEMAPYAQYSFLEPYNVVSGYVASLPVDLNLGYVPGRGGDGAYPYIKEMTYNPVATLTDLNTSTTKTLLGEGFEVNFDPTKVKCVDGEEPVLHSTNVLPAQQYYCKAQKGNPGIVVITW